MAKQYFKHPEGKFEAVVKSHRLGQASTGTEFVLIVFETEIGDVAYRGWLTDKCMPWVKTALDNLGFDGGSLQDLDDGVCLVGKQAQIVVRHSVYNNEIKASVMFVNKMGGENNDKGDQGRAAIDVTRFDKFLQAEQRDEARQIIKKKKKPQDMMEPVPPQDLNEIEDSEIPF